MRYKVRLTWPGRIGTPVFTVEAVSKDEAVDKAKEQAVNWNKLQKSYISLVDVDYTRV